MNNKIKILACFVLIFSVVAGIAVAGNAASGVPLDAVIYGDNAYKVYSSGCSRATAESNCRSMGGHLVYIESGDELRFLQKLSRDSYWCGAEGSDNIWSWGGSGSVNSSYWAGGVAPSASQGSNAVINLASGNLLQRGNNGDSGGYICEWEGGAAALTTTTTTKTTTTSQQASSTQTNTGSSSSKAAGTSSTTTSADFSSSVGSTAVTVPVAITDAYTPVTAISRPTILATLPTTAVTVLVEGESLSVNADPLAFLNIGDTIFVYENQFYYKVADDSEVVIAYYVGESSEVEIPAEIDGMPVKYVSQRAFQKTELTAVTIPPSVIIIDDSAFCNVSPGFLVYGAKSTEAEVFAAKFGYQFIEQDFEDENGGKDGQKKADNKDDDDSLYGNKLVLISTVLAVAFVVAAVVVFLLLRKKRMAEEMIEAMGFDKDDDEADDDDTDDDDTDDDDDDDNDADDSDDKDDGDADENADDAVEPELFFPDDGEAEKSKGDGPKFTEASEQPSLGKPPRDE